ncbi:MAG TPA: HAMP domain-containing sensor histidine kinase, partial [Anaerolineaceae bacterium]|nr:HAMP domain-containing sensor histidine kinase [Anaerolineaceae bacterium]
HFKNLDTLKSEFVATVSHDLRSPLSLIRGHANMLRNVGELNEQQKIFLKNILDGIDNMTALVNTLLDLGRIEAGVGLKIEELSAQSVIEQVMQSLRLEAAQKNITLELMPGSVNGKIEADQALLRQALYNLLDNAIRYTPQKGKVRIGVQRSEDSVIFEVHDTGIGIAPLDLPRVFEKFYRCGHREAQQQRGTGLGLAIVKSIAERHNGQVWAESQLGKGSSFYLEIPLEPVKKVVA